MTLPSDLPPEHSHSGVRPADRLGFTLFLAALIHLALIIGLGFTFVEPQQISKTLEITLATFKSEKKPEKADFLAQDNQQGSGTLDKKAVPKTTEVAPFQDNKINKVTPPPVAKPEVKQAAPKAAVATIAPKPQKAATQREAVKTEPAPSKPAPTFDSSQLSSEISSLEAELAHAAIERIGVEVQMDLLLDYGSNIKQYAQLHEFFRRQQPPLLAIWGRNDPFFIPAGAEAFKRDNPNAAVRFVDSGHFAIETHGPQIGAAMVEFLERARIS